MSNIVKLIVSILICELAGIAGSAFTFTSVTGWYAGLSKPAFNPPNGVFGPVWTLLYLLMGISLFLIWREGLNNKSVKSAFIVFMIQLLVNFLWSVIFFGGKSIIGGLITIIVLWILILITIIKFRSISKVSSLLLIPYLLWVSFATVLNYFIFRLN